MYVKEKASKILFVKQHNEYSEKIFQLTVVGIIDTRFAPRNLVALLPKYVINHTITYQAKNYDYTNKEPQHKYLKDNQVKTTCKN